MFKTNSTAIRRNTFTLSARSVEKHLLKSSSVNAEPLIDLAKFREYLDLKVAAKLALTTLDPISLIK